MDWIPDAKCRHIYHERDSADIPGAFICIVAGEVQHMRDMLSGFLGYGYM